MIAVSQIQTMTSLQIAEVTGKQHSNVMRDIRNILEQLEDKRQFNFELSYREQQMPNGGTKQVSCYILTKKDSLLLASGYDANLRAKIINRWEELEREHATGGYLVPQTFSEALRLAAEQAERIEKQQKQIAEMSPKAEFFDAVADSKTAISIGELAKILGIKGYGRNNLFEFLRRNDVLDRNNVPMQRYVDAGYFRVIEQHYMRNSEPCVNIKTLVYQRGVDFVRRLIAKRDAVVA